MIIIGLGTGRCGTQTFAKMFDLPHEKYSYKDLKSDVSPRYIDYIKYIDKRTEALFVCLKRDKDSTVNSFVRNNIMNEEEASYYYDYYYTVVENLAIEMDNFRIFNTEDLNDPAEIERFLGKKSTPTERITGVCKLYSNE